jgi:hypothetical protein
LDCLRAALSHIFDVHTALRAGNDHWAAVVAAQEKAVKRTAPQIHHVVDSSPIHENAQVHFAAHVQSFH